MKKNCDCVCHKLGHVYCDCPTHAAFNSPAPAVPGGAGEPRGAVGEYLGVDEKRGAQKGVQP